MIRSQGQPVQPTLIEQFAQLRSYMKQARKDGLTLLQRLGTNAHFAYNDAVQDLTPRCMHWVNTVLGNLVLPSVNRTREEIQSGRTRQFKARICIVAWDTSVPNQEIVVDEQVLVWYKNRFYRASQHSSRRHRPKSKSTRTSSITWPRKSKRQLGLLRRKAEAEPSPKHKQEWNDYYRQWSDYEWEEWRRRNQGRQYRDDRRGYHR